MASNFLKIKKGLSLSPQAAPPSDPSEGDIYLDEVLGLQSYTGGSWGDLGSGGGGGTGLTPVSENTDFTAVPGELYLTDTSDNTILATLSAGGAGRQIRFIDSEQTWSTNALTVTPASGETIMGLSANESLICDVSGAWVELVWDDTNNFWTVTSNGAVNEAAVEYASCSGTWDAASSTTVFGSSGSAMGGALTASRDKTITWATPPNPTDRIELWFSQDQVNWYPAATSRIGSGNFVMTNTYTSAGISNSGAQLYPSGNQTVVRFCQYLAVANDDSPTTDWPSSMAYWVVTKTSGRSVSYPEVVPGVSGGIVPAQGLPGRTDGSAVAAGYVGETVSTTMIATSTTTHDSFITTTGTLEIPTAGRWRIFWSQTGYINAPDTGETEGTAQIFNSDDSDVSAEMKSIGNAKTTALGYISWSLEAVVDLTSAKSFIGRLKSTTNGGSPTTGGVGSRSTGTFYAARIA